MRTTDGKGRTLSSARRSRLFRLAALLAVPLTLLAGAELLLRCAGYGYPTEFFLTRQIDGCASLIDNQSFGRRFFPPGLTRSPRPLALPSRKAPETRRIFVLGESAAMGDPEPRFGLPRMLQVLLEERFTNTQFQVVNAAMVAINSNVVLPIARECAERDGDLWVIYMGNNEMIGPFGCISKFGIQAPPRALIRASVAVKSTRLGQAFSDLGYCLRPNRNTPDEWPGMRLWDDQQVQPDAASTTRVYDHFEANLRDILEAGRRAGIPIVLCTVATNLRDCAPFRSVHARTLSASDLQAWEKAYAEGCALDGRGAIAEAGVQYRRALSLDNRFADLCFRAGRNALAQGHGEEARALFRDARDRDALPFRADTRINEIIRRCAQAYAGSGVVLVDTEDLLARSSPQKIPGQEYFYEHVHLNSSGNYLLARAIGDATVAALRLSTTGDTASPGGNSISVGPVGGAGGVRDWRCESDLLAALGFTDWNRHRILDHIRERMEQPPFTHQLNHNEQMAAMREALQKSRAATKPARVDGASRAAMQAVQRRPKDWELRWNLAELLDMAGQSQAAEEQWRSVIALTPHAQLAWYNLGKLLERQSRMAEAVRAYQQCLEIQEDDLEARFALGSLLCRQGKTGEGIRHLRRVVEERARSSPAHLALGLALRQAGRADLAAREFEAVLRLDPNHRQARQLLNGTDRPY